MFNTFNMGVGFVIITPPEQSDAVIQQLAQDNTAAWVMGEIIEKVSDDIVFQP